MRFATGLIALSAIVAGVSAQEPSGTTTLTSTMTKTFTITECNPTVTNCPLRSSSTPVSVATTSAAAVVTPSSVSTPIWSVSNATVPVGPTGGVSSFTTATPTGGDAPTDGVDTPAESAVPTAGAGSLMANTGLVAAALAAYVLF